MVSVSKTATYCIVILFCIGDPQTTLTTPIGWAFVQIFYTATQSKAGTAVMTPLLIAMYIFATFGFVAAASRQAWAFSRDFGLPFSNIFNQVY
jgi:choline transport protein